MNIKSPASILFSAIVRDSLIKEPQWIKTKFLNLSSGWIWYNFSLSFENVSNLWQGTVIFIGCSYEINLTWKV